MVARTLLKLLQVLVGYLSTGPLKPEPGIRPYLRLAVLVAIAVTAATLFVVTCYGNEPL